MKSFKEFLNEESEKYDSVKDEVKLADKLTKSKKDIVKVKIDDINHTMHIDNRVSNNVLQFTKQIGNGLSRSTSVAVKGVGCFDVPRHNVKPSDFVLARKEKFLKAVEDAYDKTVRAQVELLLK